MILIDYALIGLLAGFFAGYLGIGGGLIMVPALTWLFLRDSSTAEFAVHMAVATSLSPTRYDLVVSALGGYGETVDQPGELVPALERAFASGLPACINVALDPEGMAKTSVSTPYVV